MKIAFNELKARNILSQEQMLKTMGGKGTCNIMLDNNTIIHQVSKEEIMTILPGQKNAKWCCDSCGSASWLPNPGGGGGSTGIQQYHTSIQF